MLNLACRRVQRNVDAYSSKDHLSFEDSTHFTQVYVGTSRGEVRETANPGRRRRTFTFGKGTAAPPPHNRASTPDSGSGKKKELQRKGGGKKVPQPAGQ